MKTYLKKRLFITLFATLWAGSLVAQGIHTFTIAPAPGKTGTAYTCKTVRDVTLYPLTTTGYTSFTAAIVSGAFNLTVVPSGCVIAAGTRPSLTPPSCTAPAPAWTQNLRYSYSGNTFTLENSGTIGEVSFNTVPAMNTSWTNPDNQLLTAGSFYGYGTYAPDAPFSRRWQVNFPAGRPYLITARQQGNASNTYSFTLSPQSGATNVALTGTIPIITPPTTTTQVVTIPAFSQQVPYASASKSSFLSSDGGHHTDNFITAADYADYTIVAPVTDGNYTLSLTYQTNYDCTGCGTGTYVINGGSPVDFPMDGAGGGSRTKLFTGVALSAGSNTIRFRGANQTYFQTGISLTRAASSSVVTTTTGGGSGSGTGGTTITYKPIGRVLIAANSFGYFPTNIGVGWSGNWGLAASAANKDFLHILTDSIHTLYPTADVRLWGNEAGVSIAEGGYFEQSYDNLSQGLSRYDATAALAPDAFIVRLGENVTDVRSGFQSSWVAMINKITSAKPTALKIVTTSAWGNSTVDDALTLLATSNNYPLVDLRGITGARAGTLQHPNDAAMLTIANRIWAQFKASVTITNSTTTSGGGGGTGSNLTTTAYFSNGFGEGSLSQLMQSAPFIPATNQLSDWPAGPTYQYLQNGQIKFGIAKFGGAITHLSYQGGKNWINTNNTTDTRGTFYDPPTSTNGYTAPDPGRSGGWSMYGTPGHGYVQADAAGVSHNTNAYYDTGYNVVIGGSGYHNYSPVSWFERRTVSGFGEMMYCRSTPLIWALPNTVGASTYHMWWWLEGQRVRYFSIIDNNRTDSQRTFEGREQEGPFIFGTADLYHHYIYDGNSPGTSGGLTDITLPAPTAGSSTDGRKDGQIRYASEGWIAAMDDAGKGIVLLPQHNTRMMNRQEQDRGGDEGSNAATYINSAMLLNYDTRSTTAYSGYLFAGYLNDFRSWYNSTTIPRPDFSWNFTPGSLCGWWSQNAPSDLNSSGRYSLNIGHRSGEGTAQARFYSPSGNWSTLDIPTIYIKGTFTGGTIQNLRLHWMGPGVENGNDHWKDFSISATGSEQTVAIPMSGTTGWSGVVTSVWFELADINQSTSGAEVFVPSYIGKNNPN